MATQRASGFSNLVKGGKFGQTAYIRKALTNLGCESLRAMARGLSLCLENVENVVSKALMIRVHSSQATANTFFVV